MHEYGDVRSATGEEKDLNVVGNFARTILWDPNVLLKRYNIVKHVCQQLIQSIDPLFS